MSFAARARRSAKRLVRHFGDPLTVTLEKLVVKSNKPAGTQAVEPDPANTYVGVPAAQIAGQTTDAVGAARTVETFKIAGADLPDGVDLAHGQWRLTPPGGDAFIIPRPVVEGNPSGGAPVMWTIPRTEGAPT